MHGPHFRIASVIQSIKLNKENLSVTCSHELMNRSSQDLNGSILG
jgi:hypothetical protein